MEAALQAHTMTAGQDQRISEAIEREQGRLRSFIRKRVPDKGDAEDILHDVFYELIEAYRMMKPIEQVSAWLFRVARNRITDLFRKNKPKSLSKGSVSAGWRNSFARRCAAFARSRAGSGLCAKYFTR
jgi:RNA polymerase sigma factor (sigma-70 family)